MTQTYTFWIALEIRDAGRVASYFTNASPPRIGESINLTYVHEHAENPAKIDPKKLYKVMDVIHCPQGYRIEPSEGIPRSRIDFVKVMLEPIGE
jgi:hypothetical protein